MSAPINQVPPSPLRPSCHAAILTFLALTAIGCGLQPESGAGADTPSARTESGEPGLAGVDQRPAPDDHGRKPIPPPDELAKLPADGGPEYNRLVFEKSPYLLQHAGNPVDWYPWGEEAFRNAKDHGKPIFLSIGYSTCHWCHVMEEESFAHEEVARVLNDNFVAIKVDREERPDVDSVYMTVTQAMTGGGGWPNTVFLTPDLQPFYAGTYFPRESRFGRPGLIEIATEIAKVWQTDRVRVVASAGQLTQALQESKRQQAGAPLDGSILGQAFANFRSRFDEQHAGFGSAPKFPSPHNHLLLLRHWRRTGDAEALRMVEETLHAMRRGGIFDHIGLGFHRYSTDREWKVPHFEKMLYDQAMLMLAYAEAYQATGDRFYADTAREIASYVTRDMTSDEGGFYSAEDADSEGEEGLFYQWTAKEIRDVLGAERAKVFGRIHNVQLRGNFRDPVGADTGGRNILYLSRAGAEELRSDSRLATDVAEMRRTLYEVRERRVHPFKDDKILADWNGLMIAALAKAGRILGDATFIDAARNGADFVLQTMRQPDGALLHRYRHGQVGLPAHLEDYAYVIWGLTELYEATFDVTYLVTAIELQDRQDAEFWDSEAGGYFQTAHDGEDLLFREKDAYDGAIPSGNSVAALNLLRLGRITGRTQWESNAERTMAAFSDQVKSAPTGFSLLLAALDFGVGPSYEVVVVGRRDDDDTDTMLRALAREYVPNAVILFRPADEDAPKITDIAEFTKNQTARDGAATAYVCLNYACKAPTTDIDDMLASLRPAR